MTWKRTALFFLVFVGVASFYYFKARTQYPSEAVFSFSPESAQATVLAISEKKLVSRLTLRDTSKGTVISFARQGEHTWRIAQPIDYPAESVILDGLVGLLKLTPRMRQLSFEGLQEKEFGFDAPRFSICVSTDFSKEQCLFIGSDAVIAKGAYAKWNDEAKYFLVDRTFITAFDKTLYSVRKKQIFTLLENEASAVHFQSQKREFEIRRQGKHWVLKKPIEAALGSETVNGLLIRLNDLYVKEFLDDQRSDDPALDLKPGRRVIRVKFQDGSEQILVQGREAVGRDAYFAQGPDGKTVLLVSIGKLDKIEDLFRALVS